MVTHIKALHLPERILNIKIQVVKDSWPGWQLFKCYLGIQAPCFPFGG